MFWPLTPATGAGPVDTPAGAASLAGAAGAWAHAAPPANSNAHKRCFMAGLASTNAVVLVLAVLHAGLELLLPTARVPRLPPRGGELAARTLVARRDMRYASTGLGFLATARQSHGGANGAQNVPCARHHDFAPAGGWPACLEP